MPGISVIVPVYNVEPFIRRCVDSVLSQSFQDLELILVDDGSPDNCGAICDEYVAKDSRVHVIHQDNAGVSAARNAGIEWALANSDSEWIAFVDSDDWIHKEFAETLICAAEKMNAQIAGCEIESVASHREDIAIDKQAMILMEPEQAIVQHPIMGTSCCCKIISRQLLKDIRFPVGMRYEDAWISHMLVLLADRVAMYEKPMYYYYYNPQSFTNGMWSEARMDVIPVHKERLKFFSERGYQEAWKKEIMLFLEDLVQCLQTLMWLKSESVQNEEYFQKVRDCLREVFCIARTECGMKLKKETMWAYFFAAPTDVIWKAAKVAQKVYHKLKQ